MQKKIDIYSLGLFLLETNSIPLHKVFTSLKLLHTMYLPWRIGLLDTHHVSYKHSSNALLIISLP